MSACNCSDRRRIFSETTCESLAPTLFRQLAGQSPNPRCKHQNKETRHTLPNQAFFARQGHSLALAPRGFEQAFRAGLPLGQGVLKGPNVDFDAGQILLPNTRRRSTSSVQGTPPAPRALLNPIIPSERYHSRKQEQ